MKKNGILGKHKKRVDLVVIYSTKFQLNYGGLELFNAKFNLTNQ